MDYLYQRNRWVARELGPASDAVAQPAGRARDHRRRQGRGGDRRRRHGRGLRRQRAARGRPLGRPARAAARAAGAAARRAHAVAAVAAEVPPQLRDGGGAASWGWASRTTRSRPPRSSTTAAARSPACASRRPRPSRRSRRSPGTERELPAQLVLLAMGFLHPEQELLDQLGVEKDAARQRQVGRAVHDLGGRRVRRRRRAPRPVADRVGDQRGSPVRAHGRPLSRARSVRRSGAGCRSLPEDDGLAGHADADDGPEGPPQHVGPGIGAADSVGLNIMNVLYENGHDAARIAGVATRLPDRRRLLGDRGGQGAARARHPVRLLREVRPRGRQLGVREPQRHVGRLPRPVHQHLAPAHGVLGLPDARVLPGLPPPHPDRGLLRRLRRPLRPARADHVRDRRRSTPPRRGAACGRSSSTRARRAATTRCSSPTATTGTRAGPNRRSRARTRSRGSSCTPTPTSTTRSSRASGGRPGHGQLGDGHRRRVLLRRRAHLPGGAPGACGSCPSTCSANRSTRCATTRASPSRSASG